MQEVLDFLKKNRPFYFTTVENDRPKVRPFGFCMEYENKLYFALGKHKKSYQQLLINPNVEICTASPDGEWIRIQGKIVVDDRLEVINKILDVLPMLKNIYNEKTGYEVTGIYLTEASAEIADMKGGFRKITMN